MGYNCRFSFVIFLYKNTNSSNRSFIEVLVSTTVMWFRENFLIVDLPRIIKLKKRKDAEKSEKLDSHNDNEKNNSNGYF